MDLSSLIVFFLITLSITCLIALYKELITWNNQFKKHHKNYKHGTNSSNKHSMIGQSAMNFTAISKKSNEKIELRKKVSNNLVLIFINSECIYCDNNIELFLSEVNKYPTFKYVIVMSDLEEQQAETVFNLYEGKIEVLMTDQQTFIDYKIEYWPSFVHIDGNYTIQNITPIPIFIFKSHYTA